MRKDIEFQTEDGVTLRGWHYVPDDTSGPFPIIVMAHGYSSVKEMYLDRFAEAFAEAGLASLVYDHRNFGASDGRIRQEIDPWVQISDYRDAITFAETLPDTDAARIGIWGSSFSGGHVLVVAAWDRRVKAVVSQVPATNGPENVRRLIRADFVEPTRQAMEEDRRNRKKGGAPAMIPVVDEDPTAQAALPTPDSYQWYTGTQKERAPSWKNEVTLRSVEKFFEYNPSGYIPYISPTPLMMIVGNNDVVTITDLALSAYEQALEPKKLVLLNGGHFDAYTTDFENASRPAIAWFQEHL
ncbi:MAG: alpha/beta hydrolase [Castellaniella sp.]|uniref:alpha/beta hydrolase n=1 Tax=Castellaniella sp. TaxID=1955812 RepID=UPI003A8A6785